MASAAATSAVQPSGAVISVETLRLIRVAIMLTLFGPQASFRLYVSHDRAVVRRNCHKP